MLNLINLYLKFDPRNEMPPKQWHTYLTNFPRKEVTPFIVRLIVLSLDQIWPKTINFPIISAFCKHFWWQITVYTRICKKRCKKQNWKNNTKTKRQLIQKPNVAKKRGSLINQTGQIKHNTLRYVPKPLCRQFQFGVSNGPCLAVQDKLLFCATDIFQRLPLLPTWLINLSCWGPPA